MKDEIRSLLIAVIKRYPTIRKFLEFFLGGNLTFRKILLQSDYLSQQINSYYSQESLEEKRFYNIGAGYQRSEFSFWSYVDLKSEYYDQKGIDLFFDLESKEMLPIQNEHAEVIFNSFLIEHISIGATKNLCKEAYRVLKKGGVFHSKIHSYDYGLTLLKEGLISPKIPFEARESREKLDQFIRHNKGKVKAKFDEQGNYTVYSQNDEHKKVSFSAAEAFVYHNAASALASLENSGTELDETLGEIGNGKSNKDLYHHLKEQYVDNEIKQPYQHNADYFEPQELKAYIESLGFSKVYFTQPFQSISPALWEEKLNPMHYGFLFSIEAIK